VLQLFACAEALLFPALICVLIMSGGLLALHITLCCVTLCRAVLQAAVGG
jgi:hypothetical protein